MAKQTSYTYKLSKVQQDDLVNVLKTGNYRPVSLEHTIIAAEGPDCRINLYRSGKCLIQGKGASDFVLFVLEPLVLQEASLGYEEDLTPEVFEAHMGIDESGKGDFFGPLVIASAYVDRDVTKALKDMNVRDSKSISSDKRVLEMARDLRKLLNGRYSMVTIGPTAYNRLYTQIRNVNKMLAWAHARAIENLLEKVPACPRAISDQFGNKKQVESALMKKGQNINLVQRHKAESDPAVAAASILARAGFVTALKKMGAALDMTLPKGASSAVQDAAVGLVEKRGPSALLENAKCHFKTTDVVLSRLGLNRSELGPNGQAMSQVVKRSFKRSPRKKKDTPTSGPSE